MSVATVKGNRESTLKGIRRWKEVSWRHIVAILIVIHCLILLLCVLLISLNPGMAFTGPDKLLSKVSLESFVAPGSGQHSTHWSWVLSSLVVSSVTAVGAALMGATAAHAFSHFRSKGRHTTLTGLLLVQIFLQMPAFVTLFLLLLGTKDTFPVLGLDSKLGLICVYLDGVFGLNTFLLYGFFNPISRSLDEAAMIDDATHAQTFWTIIIPLVYPVLIVAGLLGSIPSLGDFVVTRVMLRSPRRLTLTIGMYSRAVDVRIAPWGIFAAGSVIAAVPVILLFQYLQKYIVSSLAVDGVKE